MSVTRVVATPEGFVDSEDFVHQQQQQVPQQNVGIQARVYTGTIRQDIGGGIPGSQDLGLTRHAMTTDGVQGGSVLGTLRKEGPRQSVELIPGVPASRTDVQTAVREGLLRVNTAGHLEDAGNQQQLVQRSQEVPQQESTLGDPGGEAFTPRADAEYAAVIDPIPQGAYDSAVARMTGHLTHGTGSVDEMARSLSRDTGMEPAQARNVILKGFDHYRQAVARVVAPHGIAAEHLDAFFVECRSRPGLLQHAVQQLTHRRDPSMFVQLAREFATASLVKKG